MPAQAATRPEEEDERKLLLRRGRRLALAEAPFASIVGLTLSGTFLTALVTAFEGKEFKLGLAVAAGPSWA
ncbi:MAG: hypothetical protein B1H04_06230 [Planctomycetales bacterium 4484_123]|nr:MAG: hypothetical protein B1H04_06230 [Planctomycetales bacterium 4484_123]